MIHMMLDGQLENLMDLLFALFNEKRQRNHREIAKSAYHQELMGELNEEAVAGRDHSEVLKLFMQEAKNMKSIGRYSPFGGKLNFQLEVAEATAKVEGN